MACIRQLAFVTIRLQMQASFATVLVLDFLLASGGLITTDTNFKRLTCSFLTMSNYSTGFCRCWGAIRIAFEVVSHWKTCAKHHRADQPPQSPLTLGEWLLREPENKTFSLNRKACLFTEYRSQLILPVDVFTLSPKSSLSSPLSKQVGPPGPQD